MVVCLWSPRPRLFSFLPRTLNRNTSATHASLTALLEDPRIGPLELLEATVALTERLRLQLPDREHDQLLSPLADTVATLRAQLAVDAPATHDATVALSLWLDHKDRMQIRVPTAALHDWLPATPRRLRGNLVLWRGTTFALGKLPGLARAGLGSSRLVLTPDLGIEVELPTAWSRERGGRPLPPGTVHAIGRHSPTALELLRRADDPEPGLRLTFAFGNHLSIDRIEVPSLPHVRLQVTRGDGRPVIEAILVRELTAPGSGEKPPV